MTKAPCICAPVLLACAAAAQAADTKFSLTSGYTDFSRDFGSRRDTSVESTTDLGRTAFTIGISQAHRKFDDTSSSAVRVAGAIYHDWSSRIYTRTSVAVSSNRPVYASREFANDVNFKLLPTLVATVGGKYARYYDRKDARSWSAGGTWYFGGGFAAYRYSSFDVDRLGRSDGHLATVRIKDGKGAASTQLWLGSSSSLHDEGLLFSGRRGTYRSISLQRVQPVIGSLSATATLGRSWYDTQAANYRGTTASIGLRVSGWRKL